MSEYAPDKWCIVKVENEDSYFYKVLGSWFGGYIGANSWRMNSGITSVEEDGDFWLFYGNSGSVYKCHRDCYGWHMLAHGIVKDKKYFKVLDEREDWKDLI